MVQCLNLLKLLHRLSGTNLEVEQGPLEEQHLERMIFPTMHPQLPQAILVLLKKRSHFSKVSTALHLPFHGPKA